MAETIKIGGELESTATGNKVADIANVKDKTQGNKSQAEINAEHETALADRYTKGETYNKTELNNMITTPNQQYVSVTATDQTTAVTDVLPATGAANTVYRVGNWDGSQFDASVYSEYAWNGNQYVHLSTKTKVGEVFDISAYHATGGELAKYVDLEAALDSNNGGGVPQSLQKGGMSVKFVRTSDNKYVQYRLISQTFSTLVTNWIGIDELIKDDLSGEVFGFGKSISYSGWPDSSNTIIQSNKGTYKVIEVKGGERFSARASSGSVYVMILSSFTYNPTLPYTPTFATGETGRRASALIDITLPTDARYILIANTNSGGDNVLPQVLTIDGISAYSHTRELTKENIGSINLLQGVTQINDFQGKKVSIIGDSISTFDKSGYKIDGYRMYYPYGEVNDVNKTYWKKLINASGMQLEVNASYSGSCVTNVRESQGYPNFYDRVNLLGNPDVIIVELGLNDYNEGSNVTRNPIDFDKAELSESDFTEAYIKGIKGLITNYPSAKIYCISTISQNDSRGIALNNIIKTIAEHYGCVFVYCYGYDMTGMTTGHPSAIGMNYIAKKISDNLIVNNINSLEQKDVVYDKFIKSYTPTFVQGGITEGGSETDVPNRIKTEALIPIEQADYIKVGDKHDYCFAVAFYNSDKQFISLQNTYNRFNDSRNSYPSNAAYIKVVITKNGGNYVNGSSSNDSILPTDDTGFVILCLGSSVNLTDKANRLETSINELRGNINKINLFDFLSQTEVKSGYVDKDGIFHSTLSWTTYYFNKTETLTSFICKVWNTLKSSYKLYKAVSFYAENGTYIGGYNFNDIASGTLTTIDEIPANTATIAISNRNNDGIPELYVTLKYIISILNKLTDEVVTEHYDSIGNAEFWLLNSTTYSDHTWVGDKFVGFTSSSDDLTTDAGSLAIHVFSNGFKQPRSALYTLKHYWGHCNTVDYNANNDCLILGNGSGVYSLAGKIIIIPNFSSIVNVSESSDAPMSLADVNALVIDCASYNLGGKFNLIWGDDNDKNYNIAYLITANIAGSTSANGDDLGTIRKIVFRKGEDVGDYGSVVENLTPFNGSFDIVETYHQKTAGYANCDQGTCYYNGEIIAGIGHDGAWLWKMRMHGGNIYRKDYKQKSYCTPIYANAGNASGVCVKEGYLFFGRYGLGVMVIQV